MTVDPLHHRGEMVVIVCGLEPAVSEARRLFRTRPASVPVSDGRYGRATPPRRRVVNTTPATPAGSRAVIPRPCRLFPASWASGPRLRRSR
jgi:hypothetical protein